MNTTKEIYEVLITETSQRSVFVHAGNSDEAERIVEEQYNDCLHVLDSGDFVEAEFRTYAMHQQLPAYIHPLPIY